MQIKYISYIQNNWISANEVYEKIIDAVSAVTLTNEKGFEFCKEQSEMLRLLQEGFDCADIVVLATDVSEFIRIKSVIFKAMGIRCVKSKDIISRISTENSIANLKEKQIISQSAIPVNSELFLTYDGLFSGFGLKSNNQLLIYLPVDEERVDDDLLSEVRKFVEVNASEQETKDEERQEEENTYISVSEKFEDINSSSLDDEPEEEEDDDIPVEYVKINIEDSQEIFFENEMDEDVEESWHDKNADIIAQTFTNLSFKNLKVGFGIQKNNDLLQEYFLSKIVFKNNELFDLVEVEDFSDTTDHSLIKQELSSCAKDAMKNAEAKIGMAVSYVYQDENGKDFVYTAMCDSRKTNIYKIHMLPEESNIELVTSGINNLFEELNKRVVEYNEKIIQKMNDEKENSKKNKKSKGKTVAKIIIWLIVLLVVAAAAAFAVKSYFDNGAMVFDIIEKIKTFFADLF